LVFFGDVIIDSQIGATIFSTDALFSILADQLSSPEFKIIKIIHAGNYDGVLDAKNRVIKQINSENFPDLKKLIGNSSHVDVTGGMLKKIEESIFIAQKGIDSHIINGTEKGNISKALNGNSTFGTLILSK
jgi:isopentenyl phosphate kinase